VESLSDPAARMLKELAHPVRLPILRVLEDRPLSASEMSDALGEPFDRVNHAMRALASAGLIVPVRREKPSDAPNLLRRGYGPRYRGWDQLVETLEAIAASAESGSGSGSGSSGG
jgi:DNA-binding transcriptional ArsR family regulator